MNKKQRISKVEDNRKLYKIPSGANYQLRSKNAIYISSGSTLNHEITKFIAAYQIRKYGDIFMDKLLLKKIKELHELFEILMKPVTKQKCNFITEAIPKKEPQRRVDLVRLEDDTRYEFETSKNIKKEDCITIYLR